MKTAAARLRLPARRGQRGLSLFGLVLALVPIVVVVLLAFKVAPLYYEHERIVQILKSMEESGQTTDASDRDLRVAFDRRAQIEDIHSVLPADLVIDKVGDHKIMHVDYTAKVQLIDRVSLLVEFSASSAAGGKH